MRPGQASGHTAVSSPSIAAGASRARQDASGGCQDGVRPVTELRDIDLALASYPESEWAALAGPPLLARLRDSVGIDEDELRGAVRRSLLLAAAAGDPNEAIGAADARAVTALSEELASGERRRALADAIRSDLGPGDRRATCRALPPCCASSRLRRRTRSSPGACSARHCWPSRPSRSDSSGHGAQPLPAARARARLPGVDLDRAVGARRDRARPAEPLRPERRAAWGARERDRARQRRCADRGRRDRRSLGAAHSAALRRLRQRSPPDRRIAARRIPSGSASRSSRAAWRRRSSPWRRPCRCSTASRPSGADSRSACAQMSVALGGLLAALLLPLAVHLGGVRLALGLSGAPDGDHGRRLRARHAARATRARRPLRGASCAPFEVLRAPGMPRLLVVGVCYIVGLTAVLTFGVPALRDGGATRGDGSLLFAFVSLSAMAARIGWGRLADFGGGRRRVATLRDVGIFACAAALLDVGRLAPRHRRPHRGARRAQPRRARVQRRPLRHRRRDRGRRARRAGRRPDVDGAVRRRRARAPSRSAPSPTRRATAASGSPRPLRPAWACSPPCACGPCALREPLPLPD